MERAERIDIIAERRRTMKTLRRCISAQEWLGKQAATCIAILGGRLFWPIFLVLSVLNLIAWSRV